MGRSTKPQLLAHDLVDEAFWWLCTALFLVPSIPTEQELCKQHVELQWGAFACETLPYTHHGRGVFSLLLGNILLGCCIFPCFLTCFFSTDMYCAQWSPIPLAVRTQGLFTLYSLCLLFATILALSQLVASWTKLNYLC